MPLASHKTRPQRSPLHTYILIYLQSTLLSQNRMTQISGYIKLFSVVHFFFKCIWSFFNVMSGYTIVRYPHTYYTLPTPCRPSPRCFFIIHHMDGTVTVPGHTAGSYSFTERTYREPGSIRLVTSFTYLETQNIQGTRTHQAGHQLHVPGNTEHTGNQDP